MQERYGGYGGGRSKRFRVKPRFFVIIALLFGLAVWAIVALTSAFGSPKIEWGRLSSDQAISAIVVRDEQTVYSDDVGRLSCVAAEGEPIAKKCAGRHAFPVGLFRQGQREPPDPAEQHQRTTRKTRS